METVTTALVDEKASLNSLALSTKSLLSTISFFEDEIQVYKNLIDKLIRLDIRLKVSNKLQTLYTLHSKLEHFETQRIHSLNRLFCHQSNLTATMTELMGLSISYLHSEHISVEAEINKLETLFNDVKLEFLKIGKDRIEQASALILN